MAVDHFLQKYVSVGFGFVGQSLLQLFTVQKHHWKVNLSWEADDLFRQSAEVFHFLKKQKQIKSAKLVRLTIIRYNMFFSGIFIVTTWVYSSKECSSSMNVFTSDCAVPLTSQSYCETEK